ncbi:hypothetical protein OG244_28470 [Streptomyces brevispora]|uniref:hypothetical protein n=1 Tax=Streptomyces brevispora TaxID=887462 RepID=UPI002E36B6F2|nr:hypothetical protein [Streptomyces brevispora]
MTARIRHQAAPNPDGCRWCGVDLYEHMQRWTPPTQDQIKTRMKARRNARKDTR